MEVELQAPGRPSGMFKRTTHGNDTPEKRIKRSHDEDIFLTQKGPTDRSDDLPCPQRAHEVLGITTLDSTLLDDRHVPGNGKASPTPGSVGEADGDESFFGLPKEVLHLFQKYRGITKLYAWQEECLNLPCIREGRNLIFSLPTSGGKTLVAEVLILHELICHKKNVLFIQPYIAIVQEKVHALSTFAMELDFQIEEYAGNRGQIPPRKRRKRRAVYIATIEKAHTVINSLIEHKRIEEIGLVVVDELHMLGDGSSRGSVLEAALSKLKFVSPTTQLVGMSATLGNMDDLKQFLAAEVYCGTFRPVELSEYVKIGDSLYQIDTQKKNCSDLQFSRRLTFQYSSEMKTQDPDFLTGLVQEVIPRFSCLLFCPTKRRCENVALLLCRFLPKSLKLHKLEDKKALTKALTNVSSGPLCPVLQRTLPYGLAYHHSGLTADERKIIEEAYSVGTLTCLACTSTLAAGVNLPAKRVILRAPYVGNTFLSYGRYKQMAGRAGRAGIDVSGESILILKPEEEHRALEFLHSPTELCHSSLLYDRSKGMRVLILSLIGLQVTKCVSELEHFMQGTLFAIQSTLLEQNLLEVVHESTKALVQAGLVVVKHSFKLASPDTAEPTDTLEVTRLGRAAFKGCVDIDRVPTLYDELLVALKALSLQNHLHLLYLVTPWDLLNVVQINSEVYFSTYMALQPGEHHVAELIGVPESCIIRLACGKRTKGVDCRVVHRFYVTLIIYDLWKQTSVWEVAQKYHLHRGTVQNFMTSAASYASCVLHFCQELDEFWGYQQLLPQFIQQLSHCVNVELIPLMDLPAVKKGRAQQLYRAGFKTLLDIAKADVDDLVRQVDHMPRRVALQIVAAAKLILKEKSEALQEEAEELVF